MKLLEVGDGERCLDMMVSWSAVKWKVCWRARSPSGTSPAAGSDPTRPPSPERCGCASAFQHQHVCLHKLNIPPLTYCRKASLLTHHVSTFLFFDHLVVLSHLWNVQLAPAREHKYSFSFNSYWKQASLGVFKSCESNSQQYNYHVIDCYYHYILTSTVITFLTSVMLSVPILTFLQIKLGA